VRFSYHCRRDFFTMPRKPKTLEKTKTQPPRKARDHSVARLIDTVRLRDKLAGSARKTETKPKPKGKKPHKPKYLSMIKKAIAATTGRKGASDRAIIKYIEANYPVYGNFKVHVRHALARGVEKKDLVQHKRHFNVARKEKKAKKVKISKKPKKTSAKSKPKAKKDKTKTSKKTKKEASPSKKSPKKKRGAKAEKAEPKKTKTRKASEKEKPAKRGKRSKKSDTETSPKKPPPKGRGKAKTVTGASASSTSGNSTELVWVWQFLENDGLYYNYESGASNVVEEVYQSYVKSPGATDVRSVKSGQWNYMVDFRAMTQQNVQHEAHTTRKIRRIQVPASEKDDTSKSYQ